MKIILIEPLGVTYSLKTIKNNDNNRCTIGVTRYRVSNAKN